MVNKKNVLASIVSFAVLAGYLYWPYLGSFSRHDPLYVFNAIMAATGVFVLSKRWITSFLPSLLAGIVYGFSPFALSFASFHPAAGLYYAVIPWLFLPAAYWHIKQAPTTFNLYIRFLFCLLPFAAVALIFYLLSQHWAWPFFPIPKSVGLSLSGNASFGHIQDIFLPLLGHVENVVFGFYHVPLIPTIMGLFLFVEILRPGILILVVVSFVLSFLPPIVHISPIIWATIPALFIALLCGLGLQAFAWGGQKDHKWVLVCAAIAIVLSVGSYVLFLVTRNTLCCQTALMYAVSGAAAAVVWGMTKTKIRQPILRELLFTVLILFDLIWHADLILSQCF